MESYWPETGKASQGKLDDDTLATQLTMFRPANSTPKNISKTDDAHVDVGFAQHLLREAAVLGASTVQTSRQT
jgi:hypothetical protein